MVWRSLVGAWFVMGLGCSGDAAVSDAGPGVRTDAGNGADAAAGGQFVATLGERCPPDERIASAMLIAAAGAGFDVGFYVNDRLHPLIGEPELRDASCAFYREVPAFCEVPCSTEQLCGPEGQCVPAPRLIQDARLVVTAGGQSQVLAPGDWMLTVPGPPFGLELRWPGYSVSMPESPMPAELVTPGGELQGSYDAPTGLDLWWTAPAGELFEVFTRVPMNHHAASLAFTECAVEASTGEMHIDGAMLTPLSLVTGLEFQGTEHVVFAAADTPVGCVELSLRSQRNPL